MIERASEFGAQPAGPLTLPGDRSHMTAGDMLREAREAHNLPLDVVASALKVSVAKLEALEMDNIDALPDPVFARALAASLCRALRIDPAPVLAKMPGAQPAGLAQADRTISRNLRSAGPRAATSPTGLPSRALFVVVLLLLAGAAAMFWMPQSLLERVGAPFAGNASRNEAEPVAAVAPVAPPAGTVIEPAMPSAPATPTTPTTPTTPVSPQPAGNPSTPEPAAATEVAGPTPIGFTTRQDSWITVTESGGKSLLRRTVKAGETVSVAGVAPLTVTVGRANAVNVQVRGKPFDIAPLIGSGGVARFEVKP